MAQGHKPTKLCREATWKDVCLISRPMLSPGLQDESPNVNFAWTSAGMILLSEGWRSN